MEINGTGDACTECKVEGEFTVSIWVHYVRVADICLNCINKAKDMLDEAHDDD